MTLLRRRLRRRLRRLADAPLLADLAWRVRAARRARSRARDTRARPLLYDRRARIATPRELQELDAELRALAAADGPVTFGRWPGPLGDELLYWVPFLTWIVDGLGLPAARCTAAVAPGSEPWYANAAARTVQEAPRDGAILIDPSMLERVRAPYREGHAPIVHVLERLRFKPITTAYRVADIIAVWRGSPQDPALARLRPDAGVQDLDRTDLNALTRDVAQASLLVGAADGPIHLGPLLGTPTVAVGGEAPSPDLDLAQRAAHGYGTTFVLVEANALELSVELAAAAAGRSG